MVIIKVPENAEKLVGYEITGKVISFNDGELMMDLSKKERDDPVHLDICQDILGGLVLGTTTGRRYVAQIDIPAREYEETEVENPDYHEEDEMSSETITKREPLPFSMDKCTLTLWEMEV